MGRRSLLVTLLALAACGGAGSASAPECSVPADCGAALPCQARTCAAGACGLRPLEAGAACPFGTCDGAGVCLDACHVGPNPCTAPPPAACQGDTLLTYAAPGACTPVAEAPGYTCGYPPASTDCAASEAVCQGDACVPLATLAALQLQAVRDAAACATPPCAVDLPVDAALVTYARPLLGDDAAGFYVQATRAGPALLVLVDPATLTPTPAPGDQVSFRVTAVTLLRGDAVATAITDLSRGAQGRAIAPLVQDVSAAADLVASVGQYADELVAASGDLTGPVVASGTGFVSAPLATAGVVADPELRLRATAAVADAFDLVAGCQLAVTATPLGVADGQAQVTVRDPAELTALTCPAPRVLAARATSRTQVLVTFDRNLAAASVAADGSQFALSGGLVALGAVASGRTVTLTTAAQAGGASYTVTVAQQVTDTLGRGVDPAASTADFGAFVCTSNAVTLSQVYGGGSNSGAPFTNDFVELHNRSAAPVSLAGWSIQYAASAGSTWQGTPLAGTIPAGGYFLIQMAGGLSGAPLPTPDHSGSINMGAGAGKVALVSSTTALAGSCPTGAPIVDFLGYGGANCFEGSTGPASSNTLSVQRGGAGCDDTDVNGSDFTVASPAPRNSTASPVGCGCP